MGQASATSHSCVIDSPSDQGLRVGQVPEEEGILDTRSPAAGGCGGGGFWGPGSLQGGT